VQVTSTLADVCMKRGNHIRCTLE